MHAIVVARGAAADPSNVWPPVCIQWAERRFRVTSQSFNFDYHACSGVIGSCAGILRFDHFISVSKCALRARSDWLRADDTYVTQDNQGRSVGFCAAVQVKGLASATLYVTSRNGRELAIFETDATHNSAPGWFRGAALVKRVSEVLKCFRLKLEGQRCMTGAW